MIVKFYDKQKRDQVVSSSPYLANRIDKEGKPTAGIRLEVPPELDDTFRLLHRFGSRLCARHGIGTKRHIKFDDFNGSLFTNIKLPGDSSWTRVTPAMTREDLGASLREENAHTQKRLAAKLVPGPRERWTPGELARYACWAPGTLRKRRWIPLARFRRASDPAGQYRTGGSPYRTTRRAWRRRETKHKRN